MISSWQKHRSLARMTSGPSMNDDDTLARSRAAEAAWRREYDKLVARFGKAAPESATAPVTHSGLPIKPCYFPHDVANIPFEDIGAPGAFPFTRGNLPAQHQLMRWANQPVIGYGLPEHTRARMDLLAERGMIGYFGQRFYNLVYDLVSHEGLDPDHPAARGRGCSGVKRGSALREMNMALRY
jgi:methylmalonyl-CoA mutase N-terminal domain/subunit